MLRVAAGDGRLTAGELDDRLELALEARTYGQLAALVSDLPAASGPAPVLAPGEPEPKDRVRIDIRSGHTTRDGRWVVPRRLEVRVSSGHVKLDFTQAVITQPTLPIHAEIGSGHLILVTKPGITVDADDMTVRSGHVQVHSPWAPGSPAVLRIVLAGRLASGHVLARPPRRTFWQWLLRRPSLAALPPGRA